MKMACDKLFLLHDTRNRLQNEETILIRVDSQAALRALDFIQTTSIIVKACNELLNELGEAGNDLVTRQESSLNRSWAQKTIAPTHIVKYIKNINNLLFS